MTTSYRIIAADSFHLVPNIVRAATDLLERFATIVEVRSGTEALAELGRGDVNMLVTGYALDDMRAFELALKATEINPDLPVIILASADDPVVDEETLASSPFYYLVRANEGERFVVVLRALLDGEEIPAGGQAEVAVMGAGPNLGPVPAIDVSALVDTLSSVLTDVGAMAVVLVDRQGNILQEMGAVGYLDRDQLTSIMAQNFGNMVSIGSLVGGDKPRAMHFYDGKDFDIFALGVGFHHFICLIFEGEAGARAFGPVNMYGRRAVQDMVDAIGAVAYQYELVEDSTPAKAQPAKAKTTPKKKKTKEQAAPSPAPAAVAEEETYSPPRPPALEPLPDDADLETMLAGLDGLDMADADALFDPEKLAEIAAEKMAGERLTYEEAQQMGVLQK